jgi:hypothetical protein
MKHQAQERKLELVIHPQLSNIENNTTIPVRGFCIYLNNICSLPKRHLALQEHIKLFKNNPPDVITLADNYLKEGKDWKEGEDPANLFPLDNYHAIHATDITVYTKTNLFTSTIPDIKIPEAASIVLEIFNTPAKTKAHHTIINLYRRPPTSVPAFLTSLQIAIDEIYTRNPTTAITIHGDTNIDLLKPLTQNFLTFLLENNLHTTITTPTRYDPVNTNTATLIDHTLTTLTEVNVTAGTISPPLSDHLPTCTIFHQPTDRKGSAQKSLSLAAYEKNKTKIIAQLETGIATTIENTPRTATVSDVFNGIQTTIQRTIERHEKRPKRRKNNWITPKLKRQIQKQHDLHKQRIKNPTPANVAKHTRYRKSLAKKITQEKKRTLVAKLDAAKRDPKQLSKILDTVVPKKSTTRTTPTTLTYEGQTHTDPQKIADALNDHYITIGHKTAKAIPQDDDDYIQADQPATTAPFFTLQHTTEEVVRKKMQMIKRNKASDIYKIKPAILRDLTPFLAPILTTLFNRAIDENEYPDSLKLTKAIELYKAKDKTLPENYRPISLLPIIAKLLDTIINDQLMLHLTKHDLISPTQYAFRPNSNCTLALQTIIDDITKNKSNHNPTLAIYIDLSKAYDTISHQKLITKLRDEFNFTPTAVAFFASYFRNRHQSVHTQNAKSKTQVITHGIPQGSTLSTTFFLLYINNIIRTVPKSRVFTYADDTTLIVTTETEQELNTLAQSELKNLVNYFHRNNLVPNPTKTQFSVFYPNAPTQPISLQINAKQIAETNKAPLLGYQIQNDLKHEAAINAVIKKLQPVIRKFRYANKLLPTHAMKQQYYSLAFPHLISNISIWGTDDPQCTRLQPLIRTQKKILRLIKRVPPRTHTRPIMSELGILSLPDLYTLRVATEMHTHVYPAKTVNRPEHNHHYISPAQVHNHNTRFSRHGALHATHNMHNFTKQYTKVWNKLPGALKETKTVNAFKAKLKDYLLQRAEDADQ